MKKIIMFILAFISIINLAYCADIRFAQITDVKYDEKENSANLIKAVKEINKQKDIDFVVFTGDNIQKINSEELISFLKQVKKIKKPTYIIIGDKDVNKHKGLSKKEYAHILKKNLKWYNHEELNYTFEKNGVQFFVVDGSKDVIPSSNGYFKEDVLNWLEKNVKAHQNKNIIILQHFPLIPPNDNDNYSTFKPERYLSIIQNNSNIKAVISGHFGVNKEFASDGVIHISTAPLPKYRIIDIIDCTSEQPTIWAEIKTVE